MNVYIYIYIYTYNIDIHVSGGEFRRWVACLNRKDLTERHRC
jgi:hypothetical protein